MNLTNDTDKFLGHIIRKEGLENLMLTGHIEGKRETLSNLPNKLMQIDGRTGSGRKTNFTKGYKGSYGEL